MVLMDAFLTTQSYPEGRLCCFWDHKFLLQSLAQLKGASKSGRAGGQVWVVFE